MTAIHEPTTKKKVSDTVYITMTCAKISCPMTLLVVICRPFPLGELDTSTKVRRILGELVG